MADGKNVYTLKIGDRTFRIPLPKFLRKDVERNPGLATSKNAPDRSVKNIMERNQLEILNQEMENVGRSETEKAIFDD